MRPYETRYAYLDECDELLKLIISYQLIHCPRHGNTLSNEWTANDECDSTGGPRGRYNIPSGSGINQSVNIRP